MHSNRSNGSFVAFVAIGFALTGCVSPGVRLSAIRWNTANVVQSQNGCESRSLRLASRSTSELHKLMKTMPALCPHELVGKWHGVNKGFGAAFAGIHQDVKVIRNCGARQSGNNILVEQVRVEDLECKGWRPKLDPKTCQPKTMGNFVVEVCGNSNGEPSKLVLNYGKAENPKLDPSRFLVDELVLIEPGLILGRARVRIGLVDLPVAYFVLSRARCETTACDENTSL